MDQENTTSPKKSKVLPVLLIIIIGASIFFGISKYLYAQGHEETDDAQIDGDINPVYSKVGGYINEVLFEDNQQVNKGDTLLIIDDNELQLKVQQAEAAIANAEAAIDVARASVETAISNVTVAQTAIESAKIKVWKANQDFNRFNALVSLNATTQQKFDIAKADKETSDAMLVSAKSQLIVTTKQVEAAKEQIKVATAQLKQRRVDLDFAKLQLTYTRVIAPASGLATKKNVQNGQLINAGTLLCSVVGVDNLYVIANFKETQLGKMKEGQTVEVKSDAFPKEIINGSVYRFSAATGAKFSLLPPDNATGNYVKVVQRIPVKIKLKSSPELLKKLRPGMSVKVAVDLN